MSTVQSMLYKKRMHQLVQAVQKNTISSKRYSCINYKGGSMWSNFFVLFYIVKILKINIKIYRPDFFFGYRTTQIG